MANLSTTKDTRIHNGEKTFSSICGAGKTGQLHGEKDSSFKNYTWKFPYHTLKSY